MIYKKLILFIVLSAFITNSSFADVFSWKDEKGVMHFTDRPPPEKKVTDKQLQIIKTAPDSFYHKHFRKDGYNEYCGSQLMNTNDDEPRLALINAYNSAASGYKNKRFHKKSYSDILSRETQAYARTGKSVNYSGKSSIEKRMEESECKIEWAENKIAELKTYVDIILKEAETTAQQYKNTDSDCGEKPSSGWHTDQQAKDWYRCISDRSRKSERNKKRKASRSATFYKSSLLSAIKAYNEAK